jgi:hypothetical protein
MSTIDRNKIRKLILKEFKMMGMADMGHAGMKPMGMMHSEPMADHGHSMMKSPKSCVSREDCCAAIMCLVECCECPITKQAIMECCQDIMSGAHDH